MVFARLESLKNSASKSEEIKIETSLEIHATLKKLTPWTEVERRIFCQRLIDAASKYPEGGPNFLRSLQPPIKTALSKTKTNSWKKVSKLFSSLLAEHGRKAVWYYCQTLMQGYSTKLLGQYFTPIRVVRLALSGIEGEPKSILDPMVGPGVFLIEARKLFPSADLVGVDIDNLLLSNAQLMLKGNATLIEDDVFDWANKLIVEKPDHSFSAVIGNPAYINYQNLNKAAEFAKRRRRNLDYKNYLVKTLLNIAETKGIDQELEILFKKWSGYSDLATYTLLLAWLLTDTGGYIAFVLSNHWLERLYGEPLRRFLAANGTIRAIVTHRAGKWFAEAQIPTHIFLYKKGGVSERQRKLGIPYVRIKTKSANQDYVRTLIADDFWNWLDSLPGPKSNEEFDVYFMRWLNLLDDVPNLEYITSQSLQSPSFLDDTRLISLKDAGWSAHQGLRTGCNEVFYLKKVASQNERGDNLYIAEVTRNRKKRKISLRIPQRCLLPTIHKLSSDAGLIITEGHADRYLLDLQNFILQEDRDSLNKYPRSWLEKWKVNEKEIIQNGLSKYLRECAVMPYEGKGKPRGLVTELSAVKTNIYEPPTHANRIVPKPPHFWYQIPIKERHFGKVIVPRVSSGPVRAFLVQSSAPLIIDANFITLISNDSKLSARRLWVWFNSNTFRIICEMNGAPLGGGALKLEAATLSKIPLPEVVMNAEKSIVEKMSHVLEKPRISEAMLFNMGSLIDSALFGKDISTRNSKLVNQLVSQRQTKK